MNINPHTYFEVAIGTYSYWHRTVPADRAIPPSRCAAASGSHTAVRRDRSSHRLRPTVLPTLLFLTLLPIPEVFTVRSLTQRILISVQVVVTAVALSGLGACSRPGATTSPPAPAHAPATQFARGGNKKNPPPPGGGVSLLTFTVAPASVGGGNSAT